MSRYISAVWKCRWFWLSLVQMDVRNRYRRSALGLGWSLLNPLAMTAVLCVVFSNFVPIDNQQHYPLMVLTGLCFWNFISATTKLGTRCLINGERYIRQYPAPMAIYPLRLALGSAFHFLMGLMVVFAMRFVMVGFSGLPSFISLIPSILMIFVLGWTFALLVGFSTAYFPDVEHLSDVGLQILFYGTPIIYSVDSIKGKLAWVIQCNPLTPFIELLRAPLLRGEFPSPITWTTALAFTAVFTGLSILTLYRLEKKIIFQL